MQEVLNKRRLSLPRTVLLSLTLLALALAGFFLPRLLPAFAEWYATSIYPVAVRLIGGFFGLFYFSVGELLLYGVGAFLLLHTGCMLFSKARKAAVLRFVRQGLLLLSGAAFLFVFFCGINYNRRPFSEVYGYDLRPSTGEELYTLCETLLSRTNAAAVPAYLEAPKRGNALSLAGQEAMYKLAENYKALDVYYPPAKPVLFSGGLSYLELLGLYFPPTIEANFNSHAPLYEQGVTVCHELSHLSGFMREDEANFIAYLACVNSGDPRLAYSGLMLALSHSMGALYSVDPEGYLQLRAQYNRFLTEDFAFSSYYWRQFQGPVATFSSATNDLYLKVNSQTDGVKSYGRMVDLLLAEARGPSTS